MTLQLATNTLVQLGLGAADIAVIYGAARKVGNWVKAQWSDRQLLEFLQVESKDVIRRKGLINTEALDMRWGTKLAIFANGRKVVYQDPGRRTVIPNTDAFTWLMTLIVVSLDAAVSPAMVQNIVRSFMIQALDDLYLPESYDYLIHELSFHIQGWRSNGNVRGMFQNPQSEWDRLAKLGRHPPGLVPDNDSEELVRMLVWLVAGENKEYTTCSGDAFSLAVLLADVGLDLLRVVHPEEAFDEDNTDENKIVVKFGQELFLSKNPQEPKHRYGMRVPLDFIEEAVSLWPGNESDNNRRRMIFKNGMSVGEEVKLEIALNNSIEQIPGIREYQVMPQDVAGGVDQGGALVAQKYLLAMTDRAIAALEHLLTVTWKLQYPISWYMALKLQLAQFDGIGERYIGDFQCFLLGYYYVALRQILDTSQLTLQEAFGGWGWYDTGFLKEIISLNAHRISGSGMKGRRIWRQYLLRMVAYMFAGTERQQLATIDHKTIGYLGKLSVLNASLLGAAATPEMVGKFCVLDIDVSCIPCNASGIVRSGTQSPCTTLKPSSSPPSPLADVVDEMPKMCGDVVDLTSHIEPDWNHDMQACLVTYRHGGRLVHRVSPTIAEVAVLQSSVAAWQERQLQFFAIASEKDDLEGNQDKTIKIDQVNDVFEHETSMVHVVGLDQFYGGFVLQSEEAQSWPIVVPTTGLYKAKTCLTAMYFKIDNLASTRKESRRKLLKWVEEFPDAVAVETEPHGWVILV
ncbi:hypothetical protein MMC12_003117 [Toensbergia leucococca]|nr:hypothetical protein [Toensbergia leucococca]